MRLLLLLIGILLICNHRTSAQCQSREFPYRFCNGNGEIITKCSSDPHREPGLTPLRVSEPPCFVPVKTYDRKLQITGYPGPTVIDVFDPFDALLDMNVAWNEWVSLCPNTASGSPEHSYCCLRVSMSESIFDFEDELNQWASVGVKEVNLGNCRVICDNPILYLNFTDDFLYQSRDVTEPMAIVWFTGARSPRTDYTGLSCEHTLSLRQSLAFMFGQHLGLVERFLGSACDDKNTVMGDESHETDPTGLTDDDKCHFMKLYCPDQVGLGPALSVEAAPDEARLALLQNAPNPFNKATMIPYTIGTAGNVSLKLFDATGRELKTLVDQRQEAGQYTYRLQTDGDMPVGPCWYMLQVDGRTLTRKMILAK